MSTQDDLFAFLHSIMQKRRRIMERALVPLGMGHAEMRLLVRLYRADGCSQEELVAALEIDRSNVGRALKKLEGLGYVTRERDRRDGRAWRVFLTARGRGLEERLSEIREALRRAFTAGISEDELAALAALLRKVDEGLSAAAAPGPGGIGEDGPGGAGEVRG